MTQAASALLLGALWCVLRGASAQSVPSVLAKLIEEEREYKEEPCDDYSLRDSFDFVVVGAGAAGCVMASRLSENGKWNVLLLEAGEGETFAMDIPMMANAARDASDWNYTLEPMAAGCPLGPEGRCNYPRGKALGGSTVINGMLYTRGNSEDYDEWARQGNAGWGFRHVLPYFRKSESVRVPQLRASRFHGADGPLPVSYAPYVTRLTPLVLQAAAELNVPEVDYNGAAQAGVARVQTTTLHGRRWSANRAFLFRAGRRPNLFVRTRSLVTRLTFASRASGTRTRALGVRYERDNATHQAVATREVVLCAGAINTPQLLMLSGVGPRRHLRQMGIPVLRDLPVGQHLMDHTAFFGLPIVFNESMGPNITEVFYNPRNYIEYILNGTGPLTSINSVEMMYYFQAGQPKYESQPNMEMIMLQFVPQVNYKNVNVNIYRNLTGKNAALAVVVPLQPISRGNVTLASNNIHVQPKIFPNYFGEELDVSNAVEGIKKCLDLFKTDAFQSVGATPFDEKLPGCENFEFASDEYWRCAVRAFSITNYHPCGTCRMGPKNDSTSVVDSDLKVKGISGLRVVDASVFPNIVSGSIQAATLMVAEKAADLIKEAHPLI